MAAVWAGVFYDHLAQQTTFKKCNAQDRFQNRYRWKLQAKLNIKLSPNYSKERGHLRLLTASDHASRLIIRQSEKRVSSNALNFTNHAFMS